MFIPSNFRNPDICLGDHWSWSIYCFTRHLTDSEMARFPGVRPFLASAKVCADFHTYLPREVRFLLNSRLTVDGETPMVLAIADILRPFCLNTKIVYLCSWVR